MLERIANIRWDERLSDGEDIDRRRREKILFAVILAVGLFAFYGIYANKAFPYAEGWHSYYSELMRAGNVPYRDFFYYLPPLNLLIDSTLWTLSFGSMLMFRLWRLIERVAMMETVYFLLCRYYNPKIVLIGCLFGGIIGGGSSYDLLGDYNQTAEFLLILTALFAVRFAEETVPKKQYLKMALAGCMIGLAFLCKQSTGAMAMVLYALFLCVWCFWNRDKGFIRYALAAAVGILAPIALAAIILACMDALIPAIEQIFFGAASKGGLFTILFGNVAAFYKSVIINLWIIILAAVIFVILSVVMGRYKRSEKYLSLSEDKRAAQKIAYRIGWIAAVILILAVLLVVNLGAVKGFIGALRGDALNSTISVMGGFKSIVVQILALVLTVLLVTGFAVCVIKRKQIIPAHVLVFSLGAFSSMYCAFMASGASAGDIPLRVMYFTLPFIFCFVVTALKKYKFPSHIAVSACLVICCLATLGAKIQCPYSWWGYAEAPVYEKTEAVDIPGLEGYRFSPAEKKAYEEIYRLVSENTDEDDVVFGFPYIKIFNQLTGHIGEVGFVPVHFFDVCPDTYAAEDAERLEQAPPDLILWQDLGEACWSVHEDLFRNGQRMGQRDIQEWFVSVKDTKYEAIGQVGDIYVYKLRDNGTPTKYTYFEDGEGDSGNLTATEDACRPVEG
ncbi:MAG: glycosyltransferase family 39 protein [Clostridia bacterium]|nr:glycosyltransferase family 39 protein [Clostridia bacterium]